MESKHTNPSDIERTSIKILTKELEERGFTFPQEYAPVVKRVIHTTADFDYAKNLLFTNHAVNQAVEYLKTPGSVIFTDTNMTKAGVSGAALEKIKGCVECFISLPEVAKKAREKGTTRASEAVDLGVAEFPTAIFVIGNAPTALFRLAEHMQNGFRPSLVIGVPVGFVNVVEAKEQMLTLCQNLNIPAILAMGQKGGSNVAASICNALLYMATDMLDPDSRVWN